MPTARLLRAYITSGLVFMLGPGTFLGVVNLFQASERASVGAVSTAWLQAHGHAQVFGWVGSFIIGIGFYSLSHQPAGVAPRTRTGWVAWLLWTAGVTARWFASVYVWEWRVLLPLSALLELTAFGIFLSAVAGHRPASAGASTSLDLWIRVVASAAAGFGASLLVNLVLCVSLAWHGDSPAIPHMTDQLFLALIAWGFLAPFIWGFSARWLPVFLGLAPLRARLLVAAMGTNLLGLAVMFAGQTLAASVLFVCGATGVAVALRIFERAIAPPKTRGVHASFPLFVRIAYVWLITAAALSVAAAAWDVSGGIWGASRHAFTVGFVSVMVFCIGQRVLPAFAHAATLWSEPMMGLTLALLVLGCTLRVSSEILAYQHYAEWAWSILPVSAVVEMAAFSGFALNLLVTVYRT